MPDKLENETFKHLLNSWPERAIQYLYDFYQTDLVRKSEWRTHDREASEDIVQEAILEIWEKRALIASHPTIKIETFLISITIRKSISFYQRKNMISNHLANMEYLGELDVFTSELVDDPLADRDKLIWKVIETFPPKEQQCLTLKYKENMSHEQISKELRITKKAVERSITSAYKRLRLHKEILFRLT